MERRGSWGCGGEVWGFFIPALIQIGDEKEIKRPNKCKGGGGGVKIIGTECLSQGKDIYSEEKLLIFQ